MGSTLLVQSCSNRKRDGENRLQAIERYDGYFFRIIKKARDDGALRNDVDIVILSAEFGLLEPDTPIPTYDQRMTQQRAEELRDTVVDDLTDKVEEENYDGLVINMAKTYEDAIQGVESEVELSITRVQGGGIGEKGNTLKKFIRSDLSMETTL